MVLKHVCSMAMVSLVVLVLQNSVLVVMTRFSRRNVGEAHNYHTSTLVLNQECVKMLMCLVVYAFDDVWKQYRHVSSTWEADSGVGAGASSKRALTSVVHVEVDPWEEEASFGTVFPNKDANATLNDESDAPLALKYEKQSDDPHVGASITEETAKALVTPFSSRQAATPARRGGYLAATATTPAPTSPPSSAAASVAFSSQRPKDTASLPRRSYFRFLRLRIETVVLLYGTMLCAAVFKRDTWKLFLPAFLFNIQNFLIFVGLSNLDAVSFQVWSQTKLLSTALFSVWLLHRRLTLLQWLSLVTLTAGVLGAQLGAPRGNPTLSAGAAIATTTASPSARPLMQMLAKAVREATAAPDLKANDALQVAVGGGDDEPESKALIGIAACVLSGLSSSYAGVYFEKVVKTTSPTLSIRNIQLSIFGIPLAFVSMLLLDVFPRWYMQHQCGQPVHWNIFASPVRSDLGTSTTTATAAVNGNGLGEACPVAPFYFWQRYDHLLTWGLVAVHAFGGLLVAIVVKYADNILKGFATGVAVIVSGAMSAVIWGYQPTAAFVLGAILVIGSSIAFHKFEPKRQ